MPAGDLRLPALEVRQGRDRVLYVFGVVGKLIPSFAAVSRVGRDDENQLFGYQRPEVLSHIAEIRTYLKSEKPMLPNAIIIAFDHSIRFEPAGGEGEVEYCRPGTLVIPVEPGQSDSRKPGWIVDGQQRVAAISSLDGAAGEEGLPFPLVVVGFVAADEQEQREQFILVNNTKPLPKGLIYELLPATGARLPSLLQRRRFPTVLLDRLNLDEGSPLQGLVRTPTVPDGLMKDNSLIKLIENSLSDGVLYRFRGRDEESGDTEGMLRVLKDFWAAVADVFQPAWRQPPRRSRLMHGAGVVALGFVMDAIADRHRHAGVPTREQFRADLEPLREVCRWTDGYWEFGPGVQRKWNEIQNTPRDIQLLANYLLVQYKALVWSRGATTGEAP